MGAGNNGDADTGVPAVTDAGETSPSLSRSKNTGADFVMTCGIVEMEGRGMLEDDGDPPNLRLSLGDNALLLILGE